MKNRIDSIYMRSDSIYMSNDKVLDRHCVAKIFDEYKEHSAEFIRLNNKFKNLFVMVEKLADTYRNTVEYKEYEAIMEIIKRQHSLISNKSLCSYEDLNRYCRAVEGVEIGKYCNSPKCQEAAKKKKELWDICEKTQEYRAMLQAESTYTVEINISYVLFEKGIYDAKKAINRIVKAMNKMEKQIEVCYNTPQYKAYAQILDDCPPEDKVYEQYFGIAEYEKELESCKKALEPLEKRFCSSPEVKKLIAESIAESFPIVSTTDKNCSFSNDWCWDKEKENMLLLHIVNKNILG